MEENTSKVKTYLIILIFLMIIFISGYIVYSKIKTTNNKEEKKEIIKDTVLIDSNLTTELSLNNKDVKKLYNYVNNKNIDYAIEKIDAVNEFLMQSTEDKFTFEETLELMKAIFE